MKNEQAIIRDARTDDILGIDALVAKCAPYLTKHGCYLYLIYTRCYSETCAVAVQNGLIIGWCSMLRASDRQYFLHQLGVRPEARGRGIAFCLFSYLLTKLKRRHGDDFRLEFTTDRNNEAAQALNRKIAQTFKMLLRNLPESVPCLGYGSDEELYEMIPLRDPGAPQNPKHMWKWIVRGSQFCSEAIGSLRKAKRILLRRTSLF